MAKVFKLKPEEEITSVIERLWETGEEEVFLVAPAGSALLKNIIGLKLLKREAERLGKEVVLIAKDEVGREMAKRVGLAARVSLPKNKEIEEEEEKVFKEMPPQKFETLMEEEVKAKRQEVPRKVGVAGRTQMSDIRPKSVVEALTRLAEEVEEEEVEDDSWKETEEEAVESGKGFWDTAMEKIKEVKGMPFVRDDEARVEEKEEEVAAELPEPALWDEDEKETEPVEEELPPVRLMGKRQEDEEEPEKDSFRKRKKSKKFLTKNRKMLTIEFFSTKFLVLFGGAAVVLAAVALYFILPKAEVVITPKTEAVEEEITLMADKGISKIDTTQNHLPAQLIRVDKRETKEFDATGQRQLNEKARGTIVVYNEFSSSAQGLVEKTRLVSEDGKVFRTTKTITVPGAKIQDGKIVASSLSVDVVADQAGEEYNVAAGRFTIRGFQGTPKYTAFYGISKTAMSGGAAGVARVVSQEDFDKARADVWQTLQPSLDKEFRAQIPSGLKMLEGSFKEEGGVAESVPGVGSRADKFTLTLKGAATVLLFDEKDVLELLKKKLGGDKLNGDKQLKINNDGIVYSETQPDFTKGQLSFRAKVSGKIIWQVDEEAIRKEIAGKDEEAVKQIFSGHEEIDKARMSFWPFWVSAVPSSVDKIKISEGLD